MNTFGKIFMVALGFTSVTAIASIALAQEATQPTATPTGESKSGKTKILETGAKLLQSNAPVKGFDIYLVGFHPMKDHPELQMEAHHYCTKSMKTSPSACCLTAIQKMQT